MFPDSPKLKFFDEASREDYFYCESAITYQNRQSEESEFKLVFSGSKELLDHCGLRTLCQLSKIVAQKRDRRLISRSASKFYIDGTLFEAYIYGEKRDNLSHVLTIPSVEAINRIFTLEDTNSCDTFRCFLHRFPTDNLPILPKDVEIVSGDSPIGQALLKWKIGDDRLISGKRADKITFDFRIAEVKLYTDQIFSEKPKQSEVHHPKITENADDTLEQSKHANGHFAREGNKWGSFPMHDSYSDESTGEERDFEDWAEFSANYAD